jgi:zinc protease
MNSFLRRHTLLWSLLLLALLALAACQPIAVPGDEAGTVPPADTRGMLQGDDLLPVDPAVRIGQLDNGLTYYIRQNSEPEARAELRLAINAGSLQEDEDQLGLAHFLEHMLFNGTERFPEQELIDYLETIGIEFGPDINAYTSFDETVYQLRVPTDDPELLTTAFDVLEDWAFYATLDPEEIELERGVVIEEERLRDQNASGRIRDQLLPVLFGDSRYAERLPIGDMEIIRTAPPETVRRFYESWYRPDLMAIVAVGDFDVDDVEALIVERFADETMPDVAPERVSADVPPHAETRYKVITDPENPSTTAQVYFQKPAELMSTVDDYRSVLTSRLFYQMLNARLDELSRRSDAPFVFAVSDEGSLVRPTTVSLVAAQMKEGRALEGLDTLLTEVERVNRFGFTASELERAKRNVLSNFEQAYNDRENVDSVSFAREYVAAYLEDEPIPGIEVEYALARDLIPAITLDEVNQAIDSLVAEESRAVIVIAPEKEGVTAPTEDELAGVVAAVEAKELEPYADTTPDVPLIATLPDPVAVVRESTIPELEVTEIELENGVRVLMKPTDFREEEILFAASSPGGSSLYEDEDFMEADNVASIVSQSGVADFSVDDLVRLLAGKQADVSPYIGELYEGLFGSTRPADLETLFQLIHLTMTAPRQDAEALAVWQDQQRTFLENRELSPFAALEDALIEGLYGSDLRYRVPTLKEIEGLDVERAYEIYADRFGDAGDFTFIFVGNFDVEEVTALAQTYLGTLPATDRSETWRDVTPPLPEGVVQNDVFRGQEEQSIVQIVFPGELDPEAHSWISLDGLETVLDTRVLRDLREARSGVYASFVGVDSTDEPTPHYEVTVAFGADPQRVEELTDATFEILTDVRDNGPTEEEMVKVREQARRALEEELRDNGFWLDELEGYLYAGDESDVLDILAYEDEIAAVTAEDIQNAAEALLVLENYVRVALFPESYETQ